MEDKNMITMASIILLIALIFSITMAFISPVSFNTEIECNSGNLSLNLSFEDLNKTNINNINNLNCKINVAGKMPAYKLTW